MRLAALLMLAAAGAAAQPLTLEEVLRSVDRSFPLLLAAAQERAIAEGALLSAQGEFDLKIKSKIDTNQLGFYKTRTFEAYVEQPLSTMGATVFSGYKRGQGNYGPWEQDKLSLDRGEVRGGLSLPLLRDRAIDERRAGVQLARIGREVAGASIEKQRLTFYKAAASAYWEWVASGRQLSVAKSLLDLAVTRDRNIGETIDLGQAAPIERVENRRAILQRRSQLVVAQRDLQGAAIELGLFVRDATGQPVVPGEDRLPAFPMAEGLTEQQIERDLELAFERRPELQGIDAKLRQMGVELDLARNQRAPALDLVTSFSRDSGSGSITKRGNEFRAGVAFELPFQRRKADGKIASQGAKISQLELERRFVRERVSADVRTAAVDLRASLEGLALIRDELTAARELEQAERDRFELGDSTLFLVNLRELATADAAIREVKAQAAYFKALAGYRAASASF